MRNYSGRYGVKKEEGQPDSSGSVAVVDKARLSPEPPVGPFAPGGRTEHCGTALFLYSSLQKIQEMSLPFFFSLFLFSSRQYDQFRANKTQKLVSGLVNFEL